ncbi:hypothetical protein ANN_25864 [Periplaneta americana]|uniref:Uncharacterized protein n=1 Tax=Periplaneta americana TaxID=6978 RepID=A0ABQ8S4S6_PERAM|nr:hypothetical protein ANN_25864 [Periplaneta americana]
MAGLCEGGNEPPSSLKAIRIAHVIFEEVTGPISALFSKCSRAPSVEQRNSRSETSGSTGLELTILYSSISFNPEDEEDEHPHKRRWITNFMTWLKPEKI